MYSSNKRSTIIPIDWLSTVIDRGRSVRVRSTS